MKQELCRVVRERWYILLPLVVGLAVTIVAGGHVHMIPKDLNATAWKKTVKEVNETLHMTSTFHQVVFLMTVHFLQVLMMFPLMHVTKILYGFWLGLVWGWLLCCVWELALILGYLLHVKVNLVTEIEDTVSEARERGVLWGELIVLALSSTPLQIDACLLEFGGVTVLEFFSANVLVTCVMSFKNTICGYLLSQSLSVSNLAVITTVITLSTLLPTMATVYVSSRTLHKCIQIYRARQTATKDDSLLNTQIDDSI